MLKFDYVELLQVASELQQRMGLNVYEEDVKEVMFDVLELSKIIELINHEGDYKGDEEGELIATLLQYVYINDEEVVDFEEYVEEYVNFNYSNVIIEEGELRVENHLTNVYEVVIELEELEELYNRFYEVDVDVNSIERVHYLMLSEEVVEDDIDNYSDYEVLLQDVYLTSIADYFKEAEVNVYDLEEALYNYYDVIKDEDVYYLVDLSQANEGVI